VEIYISFKNIGTAPADDVYIRMHGGGGGTTSGTCIEALGCDPPHKPWSSMCDKYIGTIENDGKCVDISPVFKLKFPDYSHYIRPEYITIHVMYKDRARLQVTFFFNPIG